MDGLQGTQDEFEFETPGFKSIAVNKTSKAI
jgi:hypothetical protein